MKFLIEAGADPNIKVDTDGFTRPLEAAAYEGCEEVYEYLLPLTADEEVIEFAQKELTEESCRQKAARTSGIAAQAIPLLVQWAVI